MVDRVAFQGETGAFSEEALHRLMPEAVPIPTPSFEGVFEAVSDGAVDWGLIPIENALFGSVHVNYDLLEEHDVVVSGEINLRVVHRLMAPGGVGLGDIRVVMSHPQALGQCRQWLTEHLRDAERRPVYDTAGAAKMVAAGEVPGSAAIASIEAAREYGLSVLAHDIAADRSNFTRFLVIGRPGSPPGLTPPPETAEAVTSIVYVLHDAVAGALHKSLAVFALRDVDLCKIESRPLMGRPGSYRFYLDLLGQSSDPAVDKALDHLREFADVRILGSYRREPPPVEIRV